MSAKVLFVDDDQRILNGIKRQFANRFDFRCAISPEAALDLIASGEQFAVVVSDMRMPGMDGVKLLAKIRELSPDTVRIMLTGYADLQLTIEAVNKGHIFRFLSKPCQPPDLERAVEDALRQYSLIHSERELLEGTLHGSIKVLSELLSLVSPLAFGRTSQVQRIVLAIAAKLGISDTWDLKIASMLFPLGYVTIPESILEKLVAGEPVGGVEREMFQKHAAVAHSMLQQIPRLERVAEIVANQERDFTEHVESDRGLGGRPIPIGARILKVASDFEIHYKRCRSAIRAYAEMGQRRHRYDPDVFAALGEALDTGLCQSNHTLIPVKELRVGMILASEIRTSKGMLMVTSGQEVTESICRRLSELHKRHLIPENVLIEPLSEQSQCELLEI
jgi:response regulator RpfG family c-di-GMP phosphodiesterase